MRKSNRYLILPDLQIPFEHKDALKFSVQLKKHYNIPDENIYNVGDELDQYWGSLYQKSVEANISAVAEIKESIDKLQEWYYFFPQMKICESNHGNRWKKKAFHAEIPSMLLRPYREVINAPNGWQWRKKWLVDAKAPFCVEHGDDWNVGQAILHGPFYNGMSTVMGHHHTQALIKHYTRERRMWLMIAGCLIDFEQFAFEYARNARVKPEIGAGVILNDGRLPIWHPFGE